MAEGLARATAPAGVEVFSAGSAPRSLNPAAVEVMREIGIDIAGHYAKGLDEVPLAEADLIVTLCAEERCPETPASVRRVSWAMPDPAAAPGGALDAFREARDAIADRMQGLWTTWPEPGSER